MYKWYVFLVPTINILYELNINSRIQYYCNYYYRICIYNYKLLASSTHTGGVIMVSSEALLIAYTRKRAVQLCLADIAWVQIHHTRIMTLTRIHSRARGAFSNHAFYACACLPARAPAVAVAITGARPSLSLHLSLLSLRVAVTVTIGAREARRQSKGSYNNTCFAIYIRVKTRSPTVTPEVVDPV